MCDVDVNTADEICIDIYNIVLLWRETNVDW